jgi:hypothetical protein
MQLMKKLIKILPITCLSLLLVFALFACGNPAGIPNGDYMPCDSGGNLIPLGNEVFYTVKNRNVTLNNYQQGANIISFNTTGKIRSNSQHGDHFYFTYKTYDSIWGSQSRVSRRSITYNKNTGILTVGEYYYIKGQQNTGPANPVLP